MNMDLLKTIYKYGDTYKQKFLDKRYKSDELLTDWCKALKFLFDRAYYQGRKDFISQKVEIAVARQLKALIKNNHADNTYMIDPKNLPAIEEALKQKIGRGKIGKGADIEMTKGILTFISDIKDYNIVGYSIEKIKKGKTEEHYKELQNIYSIGPKISSFYLRDLVCLYSLEQYLDAADLSFLQPIDTWVRQVAYRIGVIVSEKEDEEVVRQKIIETCKDVNLSMKFNQGAWYIGHHSLDIVLENWEKLL